MFWVTKKQKAAALRAYGFAGISFEGVTPSFKISFVEKGRLFANDRKVDALTITKMIARNKNWVNGIILNLIPYYPMGNYSVDIGLVEKDFEIADENNPVDIFQGFSPREIVSMLNLFFSNRYSGRDRFWIDQATVLCENILGVLRHCPEQYSIADLYDFLWADDKLADAFPLARASAFSADAREEIEKCENFYYNIYGQYEEAVKKGILDTCVPMLAPFHQSALKTTLFNGLSKNNIFPIDEFASKRTLLISIPESGFGYVPDFIQIIMERKIKKFVQENSTESLFYITMFADEQKKIPDKSAS